MQRWELGSDGVTGWIYPCEENRNTLDSAASGSWLYPETPHRDVPMWSPVLDQPGSFPPLPFALSLASICSLPGSASWGQSGWTLHHKGYLDTTGLGKETTLELQEAPGSSQRDGMCPVTVTALVTPDPRWNGADAPKPGADFPLLGNLEQLSCLGFELWVFQTVDSHPAKISLRGMCTADVGAFLIPRVQNSRPARAASCMDPRRKGALGWAWSCRGNYWNTKFLGEENKAPWKTSVPTGMNWIIVMLNPEEKRRKMRKVLFGKEEGK